MGGHLGYEHEYAYSESQMVWQQAADHASSGYKSWSGLAVYDCASHAKEKIHAFELRLKIEGYLNLDRITNPQTGKPLLFLHNDRLGNTISELQSALCREWHVEEVEVDFVTADGESCRAEMPNAMALRMSKTLRITERMNQWNFFLPMEMNVPEISEFSLFPCRFFVNRPVVCKLTLPNLGGNTTPSNRQRLKFAVKFNIQWEKLVPGAFEWSRVEVQNLNVCIPGEGEVGAQLRACVQYDDVKDAPLAILPCESLVEAEPTEFWIRDFIDIEDLHQLVHEVASKESMCSKEVSDNTSEDNM